MNRPRTSLPIEEKKLIPLLAALALFLSAMEYMIPKPVPFFRIGLANIPIILGLYVLNPAGILLLTFMKVIGQGIINGTLFSFVFLFSAAGSFASSLCMFSIKALFGKRITPVGISVFGALASNSIQLLLARYFIFGRSVIYLGIPLLAIGLAASFILGHFCRWYMEKSTLFGEEHEA